MFEDSRIRAQLLKGTLPLLILSTLRDGELHGYQIARQIRQRSGDTFAPSEGSLYPALHRLEADGALEATWRDGDGGPRRRYYRLTKAGLGALERAERDWATFSGGIAAVTLRSASDA